jgi:hypothetical protein
MIPTALSRTMLNGVIAERSAGRLDIGSTSNDRLLALV